MSSPCGRAAVQAVSASQLAMPVAASTRVRHATPSASKSASPSKSASVKEREPVNEREPVKEREPQSVAQPDQLIQPEHVKEPEPVGEQQPEPVQVTEPEPVAVAVAHQIPEPVAVAQPVAQGRGDLRDQPARAAQLEHRAWRHCHLLDLGLEHGTRQQGPVTASSSARSMKFPRFTLCPSAHGTRCTIASLPANQAFELMITDQVRAAATVGAAITLTVNVDASSLSPAEAAVTTVVSQQPPVGGSIPPLPPTTLQPIPGTPSRRPALVACSRR